jgi:hypothetical protein
MLRPKSNQPEDKIPIFLLIVSKALALTISALQACRCLPNKRLRVTMHGCMEVTVDTALIEELA